MKFAALTALVSLSVLVSGAPLESRQAANGTFAAVGNVKTSTVAIKNVAQKGAAYFITNDPTGNFIVAMDILADGKVKLSKAVSTGGLGSHGQATGPDALFSQGSIKVSTAGQYLLAVNAQSNTLSMFSINPKQPTQLKLVAGPSSSEGEFPVSVAINKAGTVACALNAGRNNNVKCFTVSKTTGLTPIPNTRRSLKIKGAVSPPKGPANTPSHVIFSEDEKQLLVTMKGDGKNLKGFMAVWAINAKDRSLSRDFKRVEVPTGGGLPFGMTVIPGKNAVLATDAASGFDVLDLSSIGNGQNSKFAGKSSNTKVNNQKAVCWVAHSQKTKNFYMSDIGTGVITEVSIDQNSLKPTIVKNYQLNKDSSFLDLDIASFNNGNDFLYALAAGTTSVDVMSLDSAGNAKQIQTLDLAAPAAKAKLTLKKDNVMGMTVAVFNQ